MLSVQDFEGHTLDVGAHPAPSLLKLRLQLLEQRSQFHPPPSEHLLPGPPPPPGAEGEIILSDEETTAQRGKAGCPYGGPRQGLKLFCLLKSPLSAPAVKVFG